MVTNTVDIDSRRIIPSLFKHQQEALDKFLKTPIGLDFSDPGTGKTRVQIELLLRRLHEGRALILAPKSLLSSAWGNDLRKFAPGVSFSIAYAENRREAFEASSNVVITNVDAVNFIAKQPKSFLDGFSTIIFDESSHFKHRTSLRSRNARKISGRFRFRYALTGTPSARSILDVWHQAFLIDQGERLGRLFSAFRMSTCTPVQAGPQAHMVRWEDKPGASSVVADLLSDICVRYTLEECHDLPVNRTYTVPYVLSPKQRNVYKKMVDYALAEVSEGRVVTAVNAAALATKLLQIASGAAYDNQSYTLIEDGRYKLISDLVAARSNSLVFFNWTHQLEGLKKALDKEKITYAVLDGSVSSKNRDAIVRDFQAGFYRALLAHPKTAAHGLTLTRATTTIWASPTYNLEDFIQGNNRIYRAGQTQRTETILICATNTLEAQVYRKLQAKNLKQQSFLDLMRQL